MAHEIKSGQPTRRYVRVRGPFDGYHVGKSRTPVLIYDLNLGGGFVNFGDQQPEEATLTLNIDLPRGGLVTVNAQQVYRDQAGVAVRFVDLDRDTAAMLASTVEALMERSL
jgi:hypothetical protein